MIISRTPFRISFFGGGTDYPAWYKQHGGAVLATTIDKYCYITCRFLPPFFEHKSRIIYSKMEYVQDADEIKHPSVRATLKFMNIARGVEIHHDGDLPARTGLGSSSAFTVGLLHVLYALKGFIPRRMQLAKDAIHIEQEILRENVGAQDQVLAAIGGFNCIEFGGSNHMHYRKVTITNEKLQLFQNHLMLFFTGLARTASEIAAGQIQNVSRRKKELKAMHQMVDEAISILSGKNDFLAFGRLLDESWRLKRNLSSKISTPYIDDIYDLALKSGAIGGKLLGAGGGGFILFFVRPQEQAKVKEALRHLLYVPFRFDNLGSQIIFYEPDTSEDKK